MIRKKSRIIIDSWNCLNTHLQYNFYIYWYSQSSMIHHYLHWYRHLQIITINIRIFYFYNTYDYESSFKIQKNFRIFLFRYIIIIILDFVSFFFHIRSPRFFRFKSHQTVRIKIDSNAGIDRFNITRNFHPSKNASVASSRLNGDKLFGAARDRVKCEKG